MTGGGLLEHHLSLYKRGVVGAGIEDNQSYEKNRITEESPIFLQSGLGSDCPATLTSTKILRYFS